MGGQEEYKELFFSEAREYLQILSDHALQLEKKGDEGLLTDMFRAAHSLKGMSSTVGLNEIATLTHAMEDLLDGLRSGELAMTTGIADLFFESVEHLEKLISSAEAGEEGAVNEDLLKRLRASSRGTRGGEGLDSSSPTLSPSPGFSPSPSERKGEVKGGPSPTVGVRVVLRSDTPMKSVRAYMVLSTLEGIGQIVGSNPPIDAIEEEKFDTSFEVHFKTDFDMDEVISRLMGIGDVESVKPLIIDEAGSRLANGVEGGLVNNRREGSAVDSGRAVRHVEKFVRVEAHRLDKMMNLVGELVINRTALLQLSKPLARRELDDALEELGRIIATLQESVMEMRMVPIKQVFDQFPRMVRRLSHEQGKEIELVMEGEATELDRSIVNQISDPLVHLIRNSVDHGIEPPSERRRAGKIEKGRITLSASHEGGYIFIRVADDGRGMSPEHLKEVALRKGVITKEEASRLTEDEAIELIFRPGFSTAKEVTDISGRGVGMDVVRSVVESLNGSISIRTEEGRGTTFELRLPLTLAIIEGLLIRAGDSLYVVPIESIRENILVSPDTIKKVHGNPVIFVRDELIPVLSLQRFFGEEEYVRPPLKEIPLMLLESGSKKIAVPVDEFLGQQEIVIKSLGGLLGDIRGIAGATILGDGRVALILDANTLVHWRDLDVQEGTRSR